MGDVERLVHETAFAKINLTLKILGKRSDGFHELESLVVFAELGDKLQLDKGADFDLTVFGDQAKDIQGENLVSDVGRALLAKYGCTEIGSIALEKIIPVAAGLGGGSADAAALIRMVDRLGRVTFSPAEISAFAKAFGADIPVCVASKPAIMRGIGEVIEPVSMMPQVGLLLVNPRVNVATSAVFSKLSASPLETNKQQKMLDECAAHRAASGLGFLSIEDVLAYMHNVPNDLTRPALKVAPVIGDVLKAIEGLDECLIARLSGSGATCFGLFATEAEAQLAGKALQKSHSSWWIRPTFIRPAIAEPAGEPGQ